MKALDTCLEELAASDDKYTNLVLMENYNHLYHALAALTCGHTREIKSAMKSSQEQYQIYRERYTQFILRRHFPRLLEFFIDVDKMQATMPPSEVQFQNAYSKQALRKVIAPLKAAEMEQRIVAMHSKLKRQLTPTENLYSEVWAFISEELCSRWRRYWELCELCYNAEPMPVSNTSLQTLLKKRA